MVKEVKYLVAQLECKPLGSTSKAAITRGLCGQRSIVQYTSERSRIRITGTISLESKSLAEESQ